jgi:hypothetical protein
MHEPTHTHTYARTHARTHTHTHTRTHTHMHEPTGNADFSASHALNTKITLLFIFYQRQIVQLLTISLRSLDTWITTSSHWSESGQLLALFKGCSAPLVFSRISYSPRFRSRFRDVSSFIQRELFPWQRCITPHCMPITVSYQSAHYLCMAKHTHISFLRHRVKKEKKMCRLKKCLETRGALLACLLSILHTREDCNKMHAVDYKKKDSWRGHK